MDQSYSDSDVSVSPTKIFERLQMLRQLQIMQRGKLQKHRLQYQDSPEISSSVTEIVSHFSNSTSYNTFRSLLQSSQEIHNEQHSFVDNNDEHSQDFIEGISVLNLSQESEFITNTPVSSRVYLQEKTEKSLEQCKITTPPITKNQISLDEMPILCPKTDFEQLVIEKLQNEKVTKNKSPKNKEEVLTITKKPFLRRGEGMARFGLKKNDLVIQNTKALPWRNSKILQKTVKKDELLKKTLKKDETIKSVENQPNSKSDLLVIHKAISPPADVVKPKTKSDIRNLHPNKEKNCEKRSCFRTVTSNLSELKENKLQDNNNTLNNKDLTSNVRKSGKTSHPLKTAKGQSWASVLTKEQDNFLRQLKQSDYYKNFVSPAKSTFSDSSCNDTNIRLREDREAAEQNIFELLENKVANESFILDNSFINRFLRKSTLECSGESTPLVLQKCLYDNPKLLCLHPESPKKKRNGNSCSDADSCSEYTECSETCSSVSTCCSCKKSEPSSMQVNNKQNSDIKKVVTDQRLEDIKKKKVKENEKCPTDNAKINDAVSSDMAEMNAKLIATSELLKDRLKELEDEIETFRKENSNLTKMREDLELERQKFYEDKTTFEQKYNEEKILSEYYLAEEKEKLSKQKQIYDRYVREMRGRLSKKDKDEVINLKKEICELKEEIRNKDAKSTCTIARLRNQIKIMEKEKKTLQDEVDKLQKENRRIQHSNDITRRLTNLKYLEQINKKLAHMSSKDASSEADLRSNMKYKAFEIERQSRCKKIQPAQKTRRRAKSVPNLNVTSRYAKYFSQKDAISDKDLNLTNFKNLDIDSVLDNEDGNFEKGSVNEGFDSSNFVDENSEDENNLEKIYNARFQSFLNQRNKISDNIETNKKSSPRQAEINNCKNGFFIQRSHSGRSLKSQSKSSLSPDQASSSESSIINTSKSPGSILSQRSNRSSYSPVNIASVDYNRNSIKNNPPVNNTSKSPISILSNKSSGTQRTVTCINKDIYSDKRMIPSPEPSSSRTNISKTNLNPTEIRKPDGSRELRFPNGNVKHISADGKYTKFIYYNGDVKENFYDEGTIKYFYAETKTYHTTHPDGLEVLEFSDGQVEKRYKDGSSEIRLPNGSVRYFDPKNEHVREEWRFPDGAALTVSATGEQRIVFSNGQVEVHAKDHKRREFPDGTVKLVYNDGTSETRYASGRVRIKDKHGNLIMDSAPG